MKLKVLVTLATIICRILIVDNIGTNTFGAYVLRVKLVQSDVVILEIISGVQETIIYLILPIRLSRIMK